MEILFSIDNYGTMELWNYGTSLSSSLGSDSARPPIKYSVALNEIF